MAEGTYKLIKENSEGTYDEKEVQAESGKALGFDSGLDPVMIDPGTSGDSVTDVFVEQDPQFPIEYLKYTKDGVDYDVTTLPKPDGIIFGGTVSWVEGLQFGVSLVAAFKHGVLYTDSSELITLDAADPDDPRTDMIIFDINNGIGKITGTPGVNPWEPSIDPETQFRLTSVLVPAGATEPENIDQSIIYDENTEWTGAGSGVTVDFDNATAPFHESKCASVGSIENNDTVTFTTGVPVDVTDFKNLILYLKLKAAMTSQHNLFASWMRSGVLVSNEVVLSISKSNITDWQSIAIQLTAFTWSQSTVDALRLRWRKSGPNVAHDGFYLDFVKLETGIIQQVVNSAIILTGDVTGSGVTGSPVPTTLATVNSNVGQFGDATNVPKITVDGKGRVTAIENVSVTIPPAITPTSDALPVDTDEVVSLRGTTWLKTTWTVLKTFLKTYFDGIYLIDAPSDTKTYGRKDAVWTEVVGADGANKALSNLASVAINTSLISDTDSTDDLGSSTKYWANLYVDTIYTPAINGGDAANNDITIQGTTHATRTTSYVILQPTAGNVGISTSTPVIRLDLGAILATDNLFKAGGFEIGSNSVSNAAIYNNCYWNGTKHVYRETGYAGYFAFSSGKFYIATGPSGTAGGTITWSDTFTLNGGWTKLGIGGTAGLTPVVRLDLGASLTTNSLFKAGAVEIQSLNTSDSRFANNCYYDGSNYKYRTTGTAAVFIFVGNQFLVLNAPSGLAGNTVTLTERLRILADGNMGLGVSVPTATIHIKAGTATANTAPLKFNSGPLLGTPEAGAFEFLTDNIHLTISTGSARKGIVLDDGARLTSGKIPIATTNGRLVDGQTPLAGTKVYYVSDSSGGAVTRKLTFINGILTAET